MKDFLAMAGPLGVTHLMVFHQTEHGCNLRMAKTPRGPTFTFRVSNYTLARDIQSNQNRSRSPGSEYQNCPLLVLNNFSTSPAADQQGTAMKLKLMTSMLQNMFPTINVKKMNLKEARRVALFSWNEDSQMLELRHYLINVKAVGVSKSIKKIISSTAGQIPDLSGYDDIADFIQEEGYASEISDNEDVVDLPQNYVGKVNKKSESRAIVLQEIGPRMDLTLIKIEEGFAGGRVLFHAFEDARTPSEVAALEKRLAKKKYK